MFTPVLARWELRLQLINLFAKNPADHINLGGNGALVGTDIVE